MTLKRPLIVVPAAIALVAIAVVCIVWLGARTPLARNFVADRIGDAIGVPVTIETLRVSFFPLPSVEIGGLRISQPAGFGDKPFAEIGRASASIPWRGIFGNGLIHDAAVSGATVRLAVARDGASNWSRLFPEAPSAPAAASVPVAVQTWSVGSLSLEGGTVEFEDLAADSRWRLTAITVAAQEVAPASTFPLELRLAGVFGSNTVHYSATAEATVDLDAGRYEASDLAFRGWAGGEPMPLAGVEMTGRLTRAAFERSTGTATLVEGRFILAGIPAEFSGTLNLGAPQIEAELHVNTGVFSPRPPAIAFGHPLPATADPEAWRAAQLTVRGRMQDGELHLDPVSGRVDETRFEGHVIPSRRFVRASVDRIDVNRYFAAASKAASRSATTRQKKATLEEAIAKLAEFDIDAEIRVGDARVGGARIRDAVIRVEPEAEE
jgi:AsmA protein